jgi:mannan endo-1,4-beta-mannosidase
MKFGIYRLNEVVDDLGIAAIEAELGLPINLISVYRAWNNCAIEDDLPWLNHLSGSCRDLLLTWEPWRFPIVGNRPEVQPEFSLSKIISGQYDNYIQDFSKALSSLPQKIYLRPMHEMNGNWYPWCGRVNDNSVELYLQAWQHIWKLVHKNVGSNMQFVWSPYATSYPTEQGNAIERYYPGDDAVDWVGIDGYNWGTMMGENGWLSFKQIFEDAYKNVVNISRRPLMIAEFACSENGGDKANWMIETFKCLRNSFKRIDLVIWFDEKKECDWRIASSIQALNAFRKIVEQKINRG